MLAFLDIGQGEREKPGTLGTGIRHHGNDPRHGRARLMAQMGTRDGTLGLLRGILPDHRLPDLEVLGLSAAASLTVVERVASRRDGWRHVRADGSRDLTGGLLCSRIV